MSSKTVPQNSDNGIFQKIIEKSLFLLVFLLPLFWSPFTVSSHEFGKYQLLVLLSFFAFLVWAAEIILKDKKISFDLNLLDLSVLTFLVVGILSTVFSLDRYVSLFGSFGFFSDGLIALLSFGIIYFLIRETSFSVKNLLKTFFVSFSVILLISFISISGLGGKLNIENSAIQQRVFNPASFSLEGLSVFVSIVAVLLTGVITCFKKFKKDEFLKVLLFASLLLLIILDISLSWVILLSGLSVFVLFAFLTKSFKDDINQLLLPIFLIIISLLLFFINVDFGSFSSFPQEDYLGQKFSFQIALDTIKEGTKQLVIGSGLGTWKIDFFRNKPIEFNEGSPLWGSKLGKPGNYISELIATTGILGIVSYLSFFGLFLFAFFLSKKKKETLPFISVLVAILVGQFIYYQNVTLLFFSWLIIGLGAVVWQDVFSNQFSIKETLSSKKRPELNLGFLALLIIFSISIVSGLYFVTKEALADNFYLKARRANNFNDAISYLEKTIEQNSYRFNYRTFLSRTYLSQIFEESNKSKEKQDAALIQNRASAVLDQAEFLKNNFDHRAEAWETVGVIKRDILGSLEETIEAFERTSEIDRRNPILYTETGRLYAELGDIDKARENYSKAKEVKSNYFDSYLYDALSYKYEGIDVAIEKLKEVEEKFPNTAQVKYQLATLYHEKGDDDLAVSYFIETIQLEPNHSNALYSLSLIYEEKGELGSAYNFLKRVSELNPNNKEISQKLEELESQLVE